MIADVLTASRNLENMIEEYLREVTNPDVNGLASQTVFNICKSMEDSMHGLIQDLQTKACAIEMLYANQPSLSLFDNLYLKLCGPPACSKVILIQKYSFLQ